MPAVPSGGPRAITADGRVPKETKRAWLEARLDGLANQYATEEQNREATADSLADRLAAVDAEADRAREEVRRDVERLLREADRKLVTLADRYDAAKAELDALPAPGA